MYLLGLPAVVHFGMLMAPFGSGLNAPPSNEDIARVATAVLADPAPHIGKNYRPTGPKLISPEDVAEILGRVLERKVTYKDVPFKMFSKAAIAQNFPLSELAHLRHYAEELRNGAFAIGGPTDHVREVAGVEPEDFETIARRYIQNPSRVHPALKIGSKFEAIKFLVRMLATRPADLDAWERDRGYPLLNDPLFAYQNPEWIATSERQQLNLIGGQRPAPRLREIIA